MLFIRNGYVLHMPFLCRMFTHQQVRVYLAGACVAVQAQSKRGEGFFAPLARRVQIDEAAHAHGGGSGGEGCVKQASVKRWVKQCQVQRACGGKRRDTVAATHLHLVRFQARGGGAQAGGEFCVTLHKQHFGSAARGGFQAKCAAASEGVKHAPTIKLLPQPVEQGFAHARGRGAQSCLVRHKQRRAPPLAANDADLVRGL